MEKNYHIGYFYPEAEEYKKISLSREGPFEFDGMSFVSRFFTTNDHAVIAPVEEFKKWLQNQDNDYSIEKIEEANPDEYSTEKAYRIRGYQTLCSYYADLLTPDDPRKFVTANTLHFSEHPFNYEDNKENYMFASSMNLDIAEEMISHGLASLEYDTKEVYERAKRVKEDLPYDVKIGGMMWMPNSDYPHGMMKFTSIYLYDKFFSEKEQEDIRSEFFVRGKKNNPDDMIIVTEEKVDCFNKDNEYIQLWWD